MSPRWVLFFVVAPALLALLVTYVVGRVARIARRSDRTRRIAIGAAMLAVLLPFVVRITRLASGAPVALLAQIGFTIGLTILVTAALLLPFDALRSIVFLGARLHRRAVRTPAEPTSLREQTTTANERERPAEPAREHAPTSAPAMSRREVLEAAYVGAALAAGASTSIYGVTLGRHDYVLEEVPIPLRGLPRTLDGYTIVQLSDLHVGTFVGDRELAAGLALVRRARPDLIVLTGDLVDHDPRYAEALGRFARSLGDIGARDGVVAIPGNHDYYAGVDIVLGALRRADVTVLRNEGRVIGDRGGSFTLLGVDDVWAERGGYGHRADLDAALRTIGEDGERDRARVLLCHNPELFPTAARSVDLQLSGHTHGGQVNVIVRPADLVLRHGYVAGHYVRDGSQIYVNRGFGTAGPPARVGAPPEVSRIVLTA